MTDLPADAGPVAVAPRRSWPEIVAGCVAVVGLTVVAVALAGRVPPGAAMAVTAVAAGCAWLVVRDVAVAVTLLLVAVFLRQVPEPAALPLSPSTVATAAVVLALVAGVVTGALDRPRLGAVETLMAGYLAWNVLSALTPHAIAATDPQSGGPVSVRSMIQIAVVVPFLLYLVGTSAVRRTRHLRLLHGAVLAVAGYSAAVSILQFTGPTALIWPRYIVDSPGWHGVRAVGVVNQPVENGLLAVVGFVVAVHVLTRRGSGALGRLVAVAVGAACLVAAWLTHTRAVYLALAVTLVLGAVAVPRMRRVLVAVLVAAAVLVVVDWADFTSDDRAAGGVGSAREVEDRLSLDSTALWAIGQEPVAGWGIGRFAEMNVRHHRPWSPETDWRRGYGDVAHETTLGIGAELGLVGAGLWIAVLAGTGRELVRGVRGTLPGPAREPAEVGLLVLAVWVVVATTVDVRFFACGGAVVLLLLGCGVAAARVPAGGTGR